MRANCVPCAYKIKEQSITSLTQIGMKGSLILNSHPGAAVGEATSCPFCSRGYSVKLVFSRALSQGAVKLSPKRLQCKASFLVPTLSQDLVLQASTTHVSYATSLLRSCGVNLSGVVFGVCLHSYGCSHWDMMCEFVHGCDKSFSQNVPQTGFLISAAGGCAQQPRCPTKIA